MKYRLYKRRKAPGVKGTESLTCAREGIRTPNLLIRRYTRRGKNPFIGCFHALIITAIKSVSITLFQARDSLNDSPFASIAFVKFITCPRRT